MSFMLQRVRDTVVTDVLPWTVLKINTKKKWLLFRDFKQFATSKLRKSHGQKKKQKIVRSTSSYIIYSHKHSSSHEQNVHKIIYTLIKIELNNILNYLIKYTYNKCEHLCGDFVLYSHT